MDVLGDDGQGSVLPDRSSVSDQSTGVIVPEGNQLSAEGNQGFNLIKDKTAYKGQQ